MAGLAAAFGSGAMTNSIEEIEDAGCILIIGSNTTECHPIIASRVFVAKEKGAKLIVADPRNIQIADFADLVIHHRPGTDVALLNGVMHVIIKNEWHAKEYIEQRTESFDEFKKVIEEYSPKKVESITGVPQADIEKMAELYAKNPPGSLLYCMGITQHTTGVDNVKSCCNLGMLCGYVGVRGGGVNPLRGQNNVQGACDVGGLPNVYPGYLPVADIGAQEKFSRAWGKKLPETPGLTLTQMIQGMLEGKIKALYVIGENPMLSDPDLSHVHKAVSNLDFLLVQDIFLTETAKRADIVLAAASFAEKDGTFTNTERRVQRIRKAIEPPGIAMADWEIICALSTKMGYPMDYKDPGEIFAELAPLTPIYAGIDYDKLGIDGILWPCPTPGHPGTPYLHKERFSRGKGKFHAIHYHAPAEVPDDEYPYYLSTGRNFAHFHTGSMTRLSPHLSTEQEKPYIEISPKDAETVSVKDGDLLKISTRRGEVMVPARITERVPSGHLFMPFHFSESPANLLTNPAFDPLAMIPEFKVCAARIEKAG